MNWLPLLLLLPLTAHADPISISAALASTAFTVGATAVTVGQVIGLATIAANVIGSVSQRRKARKAAAKQRSQYNASLEDRSVTLLQANPPQRVIYGRCIVGGDVVGVFTTDKTGTRQDGSSYTKADAYKHLVIVLAAHEVQAINDVFVDGVSIGPLDGNGWVTGGDFKVTGKVAVGTRSIAAGAYVDVSPAVIDLRGVYSTSGSGLDAEYTTQTVTLSLGNTRITNGNGVAVTVNYTYDPAPARFKVDKHLGTTTQTVSAYLNSVAPTEWTSNHRLRGLAYVVVTLDLEEPRFQGGLPQLTFDVSGRKVLDTRTSTTAYSENPALIVRDFLTSPWGFGVDAGEIDTTACTAAANACDARLLASVQSRVKTFVVSATLDTVTISSAFELETGLGVRFTTTGTLPAPLSAGVTYYMIATADRNNFKLATSIANAFAGTAIDITSVGSGTHTVSWYDYPAYTCNGAFATDGSGKEGVLEDLVETMGGTATYGATWMIQAGAWVAPVMALTDDDLDGQIEIVQAGAGLDAIINGVRGQYIPTGKGTPVDMDPYQNATFLAADGQELWADVTLPFVGNKVRAANLARIMVERARDGLVCRYPAKLKAWPLQIGDRVTVTSAEYGWSAKTFRVTDWQFGASTAVILTLQEDAAAIYDLADAVTADPAPNTGLPSPWTVAALANVTATSGNTTTLKSGTEGIIPRVLVAWDAPTDPYITGPGGAIVIEWQRPGGAWVKQDVPGDSTSAYLTGVAHAEPTLIRVYARNPLGAEGPSVYLSHVVSGGTTAGPGVNLIYNSAFEHGLNGWADVESNGPTRDVSYNVSSTWRLLPTNAPWNSVFYVGQGDAGTDDAHYWGRKSFRISVKPNTRYILSGYMQPQRCTGSLFARVYDSADGSIADGQGGGNQADFTQSNANSLDKFVRVSGAFTTGATAAYVIVVIRKGDTTSGTSSYLFATRLMLEEATDTSAVSDWSPGPDVPINGVTTTGLVASAATELVSLSGESGSGSYARGSSPTSDPAKIVVLEQISWANTTGESVTLEVAVSCIADHTLVGPGSASRMKLSVSTSSHSDYTTSDGDAIGGESISFDTQFSATKTYTLANGSTAYAALLGFLLPDAGSTATVSNGNTELRIAAIKR